jgi:hypothetical protein
VRRIYYTLITLLLITVAVLLMIQCVTIKKMGDHPFTRPLIAEHFAPIAVPVYACLGLVAVGFALSPLLPAAPDSTPDRDVVTLRRLQRKTDLKACPAELTRAVCKQRRARNFHYYLTLTLLAIGTATFLWYCMDSRHFTDDWNRTMIDAMAWLAPCMGVPALYGIFTAYFCRSSVTKEIALLRTAPSTAVSPAPKGAAKSEWWMPYVQGGIVAIGIGLVVYGALNKGALDMLWKAINICKECIGIG